MHLKPEITKRRKCESETRKRKNEIMSGFRLQKKKRRKGTNANTRNDRSLLPYILIKLSFSVNSTTIYFSINTKYYNSPIAIYTYAESEHNRLQND